MEIIVEKDVKIEDGKHTGVITDVQYRESPYRYTDVIIEAEDKAKLKAGYPTKLTESSKLGQLLKRFGVTLVEGQHLDPNKVLIGKRCQFVTMTKDTEKGKFANVMADSLTTQQQ